MFHFQSLIFFYLLNTRFYQKDELLSFINLKVFFWLLIRFISVLLLRISYKFQLLFQELLIFNSSKEVKHSKVFVVLLILFPWLFTPMFFLIKFYFFLINRVLHKQFNHCFRFYFVSFICYVHLFLVKRSFLKRLPFQLLCISTLKLQLF